jgi:anti-anti-sigma factor
LDRVSASEAEGRGFNSLLAYLHSRSLFKKGVLIKFRTRISGLFEIIQPVMEKGEVFDSTLLKNMINSLIAEGKRNFAIDLSPLDYIYSDAINVILALNRRILDVSGMLSLMGPSPEVRQILERTGIQNILKIFDTETDLLKSSEDIILQTTRYNLADLQTYQQPAPPPPPKPKSEFEDFRSEISTAMTPGAGGIGSEPDRGYRQPPPPLPPPQQQFGAKQPRFKEEDFEAAYKSFETEQDTFAPQPPPIVQRPQPQQYAEPYTPPPVTPPPRQQSQQYKRPEQEFAPVQEPRPPVHRRDADFTPPRPPEPAPLDIEEEFHPEPPRQKAKAKAPAEERSGREYEDFAREEEDAGEPKKGSAVPAIITILIVLLLGAGGYFAYITFVKGGQKAAIAPVVSQPQEQIPEVSQPAAPAAEQPAAPSAAEVPPAAAPAAAAPKVQTPPPAPAKAIEETVDRSARKEKIKSPVKKEKAAAVAASEPVRKPAREESSSPTGKITITSNPSGASVKVDDKVIGVTPYVWNKPSVYGEVTISLSKTGYKDGVKTIEFTGTNVSESFKLEKEEAPVVAKPAPKAPEPEPVAAEEPPPPPPPKPTPAPRAVAPAPAPAPAPEEPAEAPAPAPAPKAAASAEPATVFIASIPPVADVYMDGKLIGKTNITKLNVTAGSHSMRFVKGSQDVSKDMTFKSGDNPSQLVNLK